jgi:hypothetical protein
MHENEGGLVFLDFNDLIGLDDFLLALKVALFSRQVNNPDEVLHYGHEIYNHCLSLHAFSMLCLLLIRLRTLLLGFRGHQWQ